ncbi:Endonuclease/Exonuclease/phosphatase family protein [Saccharopolyspora shandongensis]|uniref:Endonuclease/Exonuclease/phosphatase family protein n=1 Tax=Saccharopolyspora shandongensis TaxID=418495 RepID=A0A1H3TKG9_9PSEU|nr:hypothetical protein [Saccharopolyspora shandongensis]SDZ50764.1 Endonuclease/Exonuclease/phosphatase family protein [Saccharopolyspora shandongensis]
MTVLRIGTWNIYEYARANTYRDKQAADRYALVRKAIAELECDLLMLQEICAGPHALLEIAEETGMSCRYKQPWWDEEGGEPGRSAIAGTKPRADFHVGLLWNPSAITPYTDTFRAYDGEFWHNLASLAFDVDGVLLRAASYHGNPFGREKRIDEAERVVSALTRPYGQFPLGIVGADWNSVSDDRVPGADGSWQHYHPDPYTDRPWVEPFIYQCLWDIDDATGLPTNWRADRRPGTTLWSAGLRDTAALVNKPWHRTVGHFDHADMGDRAIDGHRVTPALAPAVVDHEVIENDRTRGASDHLPVVTTLDLDRLP